MARKPKVSAEARDAALAELHHILKPGSYVTVVCVKDGRNGSAHYRIFVPDTYASSNAPYARDVTHLYKRAVIDQADFDAVKMSGYGYSKAFQIVYNLGGTMWPNGTPEPHGTRNGEPDTAGGYALKQA